MTAPRPAVPTATSGALAVPDTARHRPTSRGDAPPECPVCHGPMWDNTATKRNPRAPDCKCRDRSCTGVIWHYKGPEHHPPVAARPVPVMRVNSAESIGGVVPRVLAAMAARCASGYPEEPTNGATSRHASPPPCVPHTPPSASDAHRRMTHAIYRATVRYVGRRIIPMCAEYGITVSSETFAAMVATVFIATSGRNVPGGQSGGGRCA